MKMCDSYCIEPKWCAHTGNCADDAPSCSVRTRKMCVCARLVRWFCVHQLAVEFPDTYFNFQIQKMKVSRIVQLDLLSPLRRTLLLLRSGLSNSTIPNLGHQSSRTPSRDWVSSKIDSHKDFGLVNVFVFEIVLQRWDSRPDTGLHASVEQSQILSVHSFSGPNASRFLQGLFFLGPHKKASCTRICIVVLHLSSESDSVFRLTLTCLAVALVMCSLFWCSRCIQIH